jgi:hypothetical protein
VRREELGLLTTSLRTLDARLEVWLGELGASPGLPRSTYVPDLDAAFRRIQMGMGQSPDVALRRVAVPACSEPILVAFVESLVDTQMVDQDVLAPLLASSASPETWDRQVLAVGEVRRRQDWSEILEDLAAGNTLLFAPGVPFVWSVDTVRYEGRSIDRPQTEMTVRGPDEAFTEILYTQMGQLRRRFRTPLLRFHPVTLGSQQNTLVVVCYLEGITNRALVDTVVARIASLQMDVYPNATAIAGMIRDHPLSIFPTVRATERVDLAAWRLAEGKVLILVEGDPSVLVAPAPLADFYRTSMDYAGAWFDSSFVRIVRFGGWVMGVYLPALYIAFTEVNSNILPPGLLVVAEGSRAGLPVSPVSEVLLMIFTIEILREAALRLPKVLGTTIGTVGAIVVGTAIVKAGIVSPQIIVLITLTALAFYSAPVYELTGTWRLVNFAMLLGAATLGLLGIVLVTVVLVVELTRLTSFGVPYFEPWAPFRPADWADVLWRLPWYRYHRRPTSARPRDTGWARAPSTLPPHLRWGQGGR